MEPKQLTAAIYVRVSTLDQKHDMQLRELREYCARAGWNAVEYAEKASSVKLRPVLDRLMNDARMRRFEVVLVWKLDRFARSLKQLMDNLSLLDSYGVRFMALTQNLDTDRQNPMGRLMLQILGAFAEFERSIIVERVRAGVTEAKKKGVHCGRPKRIFSRDEALRMQKTGLGLRAIAEKMGVHYSTVSRALGGVAKANPE